MNTPLLQEGRNPAPPGARTGASAEAIRSHYDLSDDFFRLWLDPRMIYSCALFEGTQDLAAAQTLKLDHHIALADAAGKERVLDIGCGWGAMLEHLVQHAGVGSATGLTLSSSQANFVRGKARAGITVREESWRDHKPEKPYDAIVSIGAFEHFVHPGLRGAEKLAAYREFFRWCADALVSKGRLSLQTICYVAPPDDVERERSAFIGDKIFPESELPLIWEPAAAAEGIFELERLRNDREDYFQTLRHWERNLVARREEAIALVGETAFEDFRRYLRFTATVFKLGYVGLLRMGFVKIA